MPKVKHLANNDDSKLVASGEFPVKQINTQNFPELAEVLEYYSRYGTYKVKTRGAPGNPQQPAGRTLTVPRKVENLGGGSPLEKGTTVLVRWDIGSPYIDGILNIDSSKALVESGTRTPPRLNKKNSTPTATNDEGNSGYYAVPGFPKDALPGDQILVSPDGALVGAIQGKEAFIRGGEKARVEAFGDEGLVRTTCDNLEQLTSLGLLSIKNEGGRCSLKFRAAADQLTESGGSEEQWTFHLDIGDSGDFFDLRITKPDGATLSRVYLSSDGRMELATVNGFHLINAGKSPRYEEDGGNVIKRILGSLSENVTGPITQKTTSKKTTLVSEDDRTTVGHNQVVSINNHQLINIGGNQQTVITGGNPATANPTNIAVDTKVLNGSYILDIGNTLAGASPSAMAGYSLFIHNGEITLGQDPNPLSPTTSAKISLNTLLPNSVALGGLTASSIYHACIFETLASFLSSLITLLDSHTHPTAWGPSGPANAPSPGGFASALSSLVPNIQSIRVLIGA